jgi:hypothetical protein
MGVVTEQYIELSVQVNARMSRQLAIYSLSTGQVIRRLALSIIYQVCR